MRSQSYHRNVGIMLISCITLAESRMSRGALRAVGSKTGLWRSMPGDLNKIRRPFNRAFHFEKRQPCTETNSLVFTDDLEMQLQKLIQERRMKRGENSGPRPHVPAIAFDIDGVFKMGGKYTSFGATALRKVVDSGLPYVLMTNGGGGRTEEQYAEEINKKLQEFDEDKSGNGRYVDGDQMILSYTPFDSDLSHLKNEPVLIVGSHRIIETATHYGFRKAMHLSEYTCKHPTMNPFGSTGNEKDDCVINLAREEWDEDFKAILVFTDPENFFEGIQVLTDVLLSSRPGDVEYEANRRIPIVFSNPDLLWKTQYPHARFGQGAFRLALEACYKARMQSLGLSEIEIKERLGDFVQYGKPEISQFLHTKRALLKQANVIGCDISHYYMIGDNPTSDIHGAQNMDKRALQNKEKRWSGHLVKTGVYREGDDDGGAEKIFENVLDSVDFIIDAHKEEIAQLSKARKASMSS